MRIRVGCELGFEFTQPTPLIAMLNVHFSRAPDLELPDHLTTNPPVPIGSYRDSFGNWCSRLVAPPGSFTLGMNAIVRDSGTPDPVDLAALQHTVERLPGETLQFLLGSRYCETDRLSDEAWRLFGPTPLGWRRERAICDFVHKHITVGDEHSRATRTAYEAYTGPQGVCRDFAHLAITFCRCLNIPARYCTGYVSDIGLPPPYRRWISRPGWRCTSGEDGIRSIPATTRRASGASLLPTAVMPPTCRSPTSSGQANCAASRSGRTRPLAHRAEIVVSL